MLSVESSLFSVVPMQVEWLKELVAKVPVRLVFESALELMSCTQIGTFQVTCSPRPC